MRRCVCTGLTFLAAGFAILVSGCASNRPGGVARTDSPRAQLPAASLPAFPTPTQLLALRSGSAFVDTRVDGSEFNTFMPNSNVNVNGTSADFSPDFTPGGPVSGLAYATYAFTTHDYSGNFDFHLNWATPPQLGDVWLGLANFDSHRWDWFEIPADGSVDLGPFNQAYSNMGSGTIRATIMTILLRGNTAATLASASIGLNQPPLPQFSVLQVRPLVGQELLLDASGSTDPDGTVVKYEFDPEGDGTFIDAGADDFLNHQYSEAGVFQPTLRVTDDGGASTTETREVKVGWVHDFSGVGLGNSLLGVVLDAQGNVYCCGQYDTGPADTGEDGFLIKYSPDGAVLWMRRLNSGELEKESLDELAFDSEGALLVAGRKGTALLAMNPILLKVDPDSGDAVFVKQWDINCEVNRVSMTIDNQDLVTIFATQSDVNFKKAVFAAQIQSDGTESWQRRWPLIDDGRYINACCCDELGNIYAVGRSFSAATLDDGLLLSISQEGKKLWAMTFGTLASEESFDSLCYSDGLLHAAGNQRSDSLCRATLASFQLDGSLDRLQLLDANTDDHSCTGICGDGTGGVYICGLVRSTDFTDLWLGHVGLNGLLFGSLTYGSDDQHDRGEGRLAQGPDGGLYLIGHRAETGAVQGFEPLTVTEPQDFVLADVAESISKTTFALNEGDFGFKDTVPAATDSGGEFTMRLYE